VRFFHGDRYDLRAWVVMPNHVHALFNVDATPMAENPRELEEAHVAKGKPAIGTARIAVCHMWQRHIDGLHEKNR